MTEAIYIEADISDPNVAGNPPRKPDGSNYEYAVIVGDTMRLADTYTALVGAIIDGYDDIADDDNDAAMSARYHHARSFAAVLQAGYNGQADDQGALAECDAAQVDALFADKVNAYSADVFGSLDWDAPVPLVLIDGDYEPFTGLPAPTGNIAWINAVEEQAFVNSLHDLGAIQLLTAAQG
jgi:hypothetical protein